jgi:hypothetical protein
MRKYYLVAFQVLNVSYYSPSMLRSPKGFHPYSYTTFLIYPTHAEQSYPSNLLYFRHHSIIK